MKQRLYILLMLASLGTHATAIASDSAAKVNGGHPSENGLTTLELTEKAVERLAIETARVRRAPIQSSRSISGEVVLPPGKSFSMVAPFAGVVLAAEGEQLPNAGSSFKQGDVVLRLAVLPSTQDLISAQEELVARKSALNSAEKQARRARQLLRAKSISQREVESAETALAEARAAYKTAQLKSSLAHGNGGADSRSLAITAPWDGVLKSLNVSPQQIVTQGSQLGELNASRPLWVKASLYSGLLPQLAHGKPVSVHRLNQPEESKGLTAVEVSGPLTSNPNNAAIDLYFSLEEPPEGMIPGERVMLEIPEQGEAEPLTVPASAIFRDIYGNAWVYEQIAPRNYQRVRVGLSKRVGDTAVLSFGPAEGTPVVTVGVAELAGTEFGVGH